MLKIWPLQVFLLQLCIQGPAPFHIVLPSLDYSSSDIIFALFLCLPKETKLLKSHLLVPSSQQRHTDRLQLNFRMRQSLKVARFLQVLRETAAGWNRETQPAPPLKESKREFAAPHSRRQLTGWSANALSYSAHMELSSDYHCCCPAPPWVPRK